MGNKSISQNYSSGIGLIAGYTEDGIGSLLNYNYYLERDSFIQGGLYLSFNEDKNGNYEIPYNDFTFNLGYFKSVFSSRRNNFKTHIGGGLVGGYEVVNNGSNILESGAVILNKSKFIYGAFASVEAEFYLNNEWSFLLKANQFYHHNSELGTLTPLVGLGFRYFLF